MESKYTKINDLHGIFKPFNLFTILWLPLLFNLQIEAAVAALLVNFLLDSEIPLGSAA